MVVAPSLTAGIRTGRREPIGSREDSVVPSRGAVKKAHRCGILTASLVPSWWEPDAVHDDLLHRVPLTRRACAPCHRRQVEAADPVGAARRDAALRRAPA